MIKLENFLRKYGFIVLVLCFKFNVLGFFFYVESLETAYLLESTGQDKIAKLESKQHVYDILVDIVLILDAAILLFLICYGIRKALK
ncbi:hypothetical protein SD427_02695 [Chryseobacterium sp. JJR-5R]|uniref:hypothetical protein n=1 Tax=Chryseobacterium sp. JJR-5R TaxID=3093923 RepID=UPI002A753383|nr:hypothetical protein [Chryseobacterium sp. JJR-5R]WPO83274.1 hypothetical protein SD427_02695 [Chryseobacterium sp. JJR-5R]